MYMKSSFKSCGYESTTTDMDILAQVERKVWFRK